MWNDVRFAARVLGRSRLYAVSAVLTLALGIGATTAVFSVIDATLLRPLPFPDSDRLVALSVMHRDNDGGEQQFPPTQIELVRWRAAAVSLEGTEGLEARTVTLTGGGEPEVVAAAAITSGFFPALRTAPALGRLFTSEEERAGAGVAVISHGLWRRRFNADPGVLGRAITIAGRPHQIVGVMPESFRLPLDRSELWFPLNPVIDPTRQSNRFMTAIGRLKDGATPHQAREELAAISAVIAREFPLGSGRATPRVEGLRERLFGARRPALLMLAGAVVGLLLLSCANVANLTLGHLALRRGELITRALMGASRGRIVRLLLVQAGLVAATGGALGVSLMVGLLPQLVGLYNRGGTGPVALTADWRMLAIALAVVGGTALVCGIIPALRIHRTTTAGDPSRQVSTRFSRSPWERRLQASLVATQIALAVALLCASGSLLASLGRLMSAPPGYAAEHVLTMQMLLPQNLYPDVPSRAGFVRRVLERVEALPGVVAAGTTQSTFLPNTSMQTFMVVEGRPATEPERSHIRHITPGYFRALNVAILEGRAIDARDQLGAASVCMVSRKFAQKYWPGDTAVGRRVRRASAIAANAVWLTIVGVAADVKDDGLANEPGPVLYIPYLQLNTATARISLVVRTAGDPVAIAPAVRSAIWAIDAQQPIDRILSMEAVLAEGTGEQRFRTVLLGLFAFVGLLLAVIGVHAVASSAVTSRRWEAGLRLALGAPGWTIVANMVRESGAAVAVGAALGLAMFVSLGRLLSTLLYETSPSDPRIMAGVAVGLVSLALGAAWLQARRLAGVSPVVALRGEDGTS